MQKEGEIIKELLKQIPKNQDDIAIDLGMTRQNLSHHSLDMTLIYLRSLGLNANESIQDMTW